jgi:hypothetical protein
MLNKKVLKRLSSELLNILNEWDPIGVLPGAGGPQDEYECLVWPIISLLQKDAGEGELMNFLDRYLTDHMGLDFVDGGSKATVVQIFDWWKENDFTR